MYKIGIDIIEIERVKKSVQRESFKTRVFSPDEIKMLEQRKNKYPSYAANWAAKEAFSKALGTGVRDFSLNEAEILRDSLGKPYLKLSGNAAKAAGELKFDVSITHTNELAMAAVIGYLKEN